MKILIGTRNKNKLNQFIRIFNNLIKDLELLSLQDVKIKNDVKEDGNSLLSNAKKKAKYYGEKTKILTLADDTGLFIDALNGEPGVNSKRWYNGTDRNRYMKVLERMKNVPKTKRTCRYTGVLVLYDPKKKKFWTYKKDLEGMIADKPLSKNGFGYDPIFFCTKYKKYYSQLTDRERDAIIHRGTGIRKLVGYLNKNKWKK